MLTSFENLWKSRFYTYKNWLPSRILDLERQIKTREYANAIGYKFPIFCILRLSMLRYLHMTLKQIKVSSRRKLQSIYFYTRTEIQTLWHVIGYHNIKRKNNMKIK